MNENPIPAFLLRPAAPTPPSAEQREAQRKAAALAARPSLRGGTPKTDKITRPRPAQ